MNIDFTESSMFEFMNKNKLDSYLIDINWNLIHGPDELMDDPKGDIICKSGRNIHNREDLIWPFTYICFQFQTILKFDEIVQFLLSFNSHDKEYRRFKRIVSFLSAIDDEIDDSSTKIKTFLYFVALNNLIDKPPYIFSFIKGQCNESISKKDLDRLKKEFENSYSIGKKYSEYFENYLSYEQKQNLLDKLKFKVLKNNNAFSPIQMDIRKLAKKLYKVMRCEIAHGSQIIPVTYNPTMNQNNIERFFTSFIENGKEIYLFSELSIDTWKDIIKTIIVNYFKANFR